MRLIPSLETLAADMAVKPIKAAIQPAAISIEKKVGEDASEPVVFYQCDAVEPEQAGKSYNGRNYSNDKGFSFKKWFYLHILPIRIPCRKPSLPVFCR